MAKRTRVDRLSAARKNVAKQEAGRARKRQHENDSMAAAARTLSKHPLAGGYKSTFERTAEKGEKRGEEMKKSTSRMTSQRKRQASERDSAIMSKSAWKSAK